VKLVSVAGAGPVPREYSGARVDTASERTPPTVTFWPCQVIMALATSSQRDLSDSTWQTRGPQSGTAGSSTVRCASRDLTFPSLVSGPPWTRMRANGLALSGTSPKRAANHHTHTTRGLAKPTGYGRSTRPPPPFLPRGVRSVPANDPNAPTDPALHRRADRALLR